jgi:broad specificity phosphatase PhoE
MKFYDVDSEFTFGKYEGKTIKEVFEKDPKYIDFCYNNIDEFYVSPSVLKELKAGGAMHLSQAEDTDDVLDSFFEDAEEVDDFEPDMDEEDDYNWDDDDLEMIGDSEMDGYNEFDDDDY